MKSIVIKLACVLVLTASLSGCIMYVGPHGHHKSHDFDKSHDDKPVDEKPADTMNKT